MKQQIKLLLPKFIFKKIAPLLQKDNIIYASKVDAIAMDGLAVSMYENKGLALKEFIKEQMECLVEITRGKFGYKKKSQKIPEGAIAFTYQWIKRPYEFFPELSKIYNDIQNAALNEQSSKRDFFEKTATDFLKNWGLNGVNLEVYQTKPLLNSEYGIFLLNEYEFEQEIDSLELNQEIYITIEELYLRGVRPCESPNKLKQKQQITTQPKPKEEPIKELPKEEPNEKKPRKFFF